MAMTKRPPASVHVPKTAIEQATLALQDLPEKPRDSWSLREAIDVMHDVIAAALDKGYSYEEIAAMLSDRGVEIRASSLKRYFAAARKEKDPNAKPRARRTRRVSSTDAALSSAIASIAAEEPEASAPAADETAAASSDETLNGAVAAEAPESDDAAPTRRQTSASRKTTTRKTSTKPKTTTRRRKSDT